MNFKKTEIPDLVICEPSVIVDDRGYFVETYRMDKLSDFLGYSPRFCQDNESKSSYGVLRGLHYQLAPFAQTKLVRVVSGSILDVAVDIRKESPTFGHHISIELSEKNKKQLFVPRGFAHGFLVLSSNAIINYKVDNFYDPPSDRGIRYDDTSLDIDWKISNEDIVISPKDATHPFMKDAQIFTETNSLYE